MQISVSKELVFKVRQRAFEDLSYKIIVKDGTPDDYRNIEERFAKFQQSEPDFMIQVAQDYLNQVGTETYEASDNLSYTLSDPYMWDFAGRSIYRAIIRG